MYSFRYDYEILTLLDLDLKPWCFGILFISDIGAQKRKTAEKASKSNGKNPPLHQYMC